MGFVRVDGQTVEILSGTGSAPYDVFEVKNDDSSVEVITPFPQAVPILLVKLGADQEDRARAAFSQYCEGEGGVLDVSTVVYRDFASAWEAAICVDAL